MTKRNVLFAALGLLVAALLFGSTSSTLALWSDEASSSTGAVRTGTIELSAGNPAAGTFPLSGTNLAVGTPGAVQQAQLDLKNTGNTPIRFALKTAGPVVTAGGTVGVTLAGGVGTCPSTTTAALPAPAAFTSTTLTAVGAVTNAALRSLATSASETWCVRATLVSVDSAQQATYTIKFNFDVQQIRP